jgi:ABC-type transport system involved in multi-copper enzyme maturation permease subunit
MPPNENTPIKDSFDFVEEKLEEAAGELEVKLPKGTLPFALKIITLILLVGGLSILGSVFTDFVIPKNGGLILHFYRLLTGVAFLAVAYGIYQRQRWSIWLYGIIVFIGLTINFTLALAPALLVIYLYSKRQIFKPCFLDYLSNRFFKNIKSIFHKKTKDQD